MQYGCKFCFDSVTENEVSYDTINLKNTVDTINTVLTICLLAFLLSVFVLPVLDYCYVVAMDTNAHAKF